jgi:hypothetical protein
MDDLCRQFWVCRAVPPEWYWAMAVVMPVLLLILVGIPIATALHRTGRSRWWTAIAFFPLLNIIGLWVFAFSRWPALDRGLERDR